MRNICGQSKWSETGRWAATLPSPRLAEVPGRPQFPRQIHSCQWLSDRPNMFLGRRGYILHICWGLGVLEDHVYRNTGEMFKLKKNNHPFSGWISLLGPQVPQTLFFTHFRCSQFMLYGDRTDLSFSYPPSSATRKPKITSFTSSAESQRLQIYWI